MSYQNPEMFFLLLLFYKATKVYLLSDEVHTQCVRLSENYKLPLLLC